MSRSSSHQRAFAEEVWGLPVTLAYYEDVHYEGTIEIPISPGAQPVAGDTSIQLGGFLLEEAQQATRPPWKVFEQDLETRIEVARRDGKDPSEFLEEDRVRKILISQIGVHRAFYQTDSEFRDHCALQSLREIAAFINCARVGAGHRSWEELAPDERSAYDPVDASQMLEFTVVFFPYEVVCREEIGRMIMLKFVLCLRDLRGVIFEMQISLADICLHMSFAVAFAHFFWGPRLSTQMTC